MKIPVAKPYLTKSEARAAYDTILTGWVTQGQKVKEFEEKFARFIGSKYAVAVSSCTAALHLSLLVNGIKAGDEVICPSLSFIASANAIRYTGAVPVFVDVEPESLNLDPILTNKLVTSRTKAILLVHQIGIPADIDAFKKICKAGKLRLIEDAACALGSIYKRAKIGTHSPTVCFSFHPRKVITTGDGGVITTSDKFIYNRLKRLRQHGMSLDDRLRHLSKEIIFEEYTELGYNYRMTDIQAAVGIIQLKKINRIIRERRKIAAIYNQVFGRINCLNLLKEPNDCQLNYQSYQIYLNSDCQVHRNILMQKLLDRGIVTRPGIMTIHRQKAYSDYRYKSELHRSEDLSDRSIILPLYVPMHKREINYVIRNVIELVNKKSNYEK